MAPWRDNDPLMRWHGEFCGLPQRVSRRNHGWLGVLDRFFHRPRATVARMGRHQAVGDFTGREPLVSEWSQRDLYTPKKTARPIKFVTKDPAFFFRLDSESG